MTNPPPFWARLWDVGIGLFLSGIVGLMIILAFLAFGCAAESRARPDRLELCRAKGLVSREGFAACLGPHEIASAMARPLRPRSRAIFLELSSRPEVGEWTP